MNISYTAFNPKIHIKKKEYKSYLNIDDFVDILFSSKEEKYNFSIDKRLFISENVDDKIKDYIERNFTDSYTSQPIYMVKLKDAFIYERTTLTPRHMLITSGTKYFTPFLSSKSLDYYESIDLLSIVDNQTIEIKKEVVPDLVINNNCLFLYSFSNLYHVFMEVIPNLVFEEQFDFSNFTFLLYGNEKNMLEKVLGMLGYKNKIIKLDNLNISVKNLFIPSFQTFGHITEPRLEALSIPKKLSQQLQPIQGNERIYISRNDANQRITRNEEVVIKMLEKYDFKIVVPGKFSIEEQIKMFASAKYIIAPHGIGIANILFRRDDFTLVEIFSDGWTRNCYYRMVQLLNGRYRGIFLQSYNPQNDIEIDITQLEKILKEDFRDEN